MKTYQIRDLLTTILGTIIKILVIMWLVNFIYTKATEAYAFGYRVFTEEAVSPAPGRDISVAITEGKSAKSLAETLYEKGLVRDENLAYIQILCSEYKDTLEPGVYELNTSMTLEEMMYAMSPSQWEDEED